LFADLPPRSNTLTKRVTRRRARCMIVAAEQSRRPTRRVKALFAEANGPATVTCSLETYPRDPDKSSFKNRNRRGESNPAARQRLLSLASGSFLLTPASLRGRLGLRLRLRCATTTLGIGSGGAGVLRRLIV
jgi:hypothetical protein